MKRTLSAHGGAAIYLIAILVNLGIQLLGSIVLAVVMLLSGNGGVPGFVNYILMAVLQLGFLLSFRLYTKKTNRGIAFPVRVPKWYDMLLCVLAAALSVLCFIFPAQWFALWLEKIGYAFSTDIPLGSALDVTLCVLVTVIIAPVCEELVFRGALLTGLTKKLGVLPSVLLSGLAFSLMHMNPEQTVYQFFMGCACAYLAICSGTVVCPMIVHACNNLIALILEFTGTAFLDVFFAGQLAFALSTVGFLALGITAIYFLGRLMLKKERHGSGSGLVFDLRRNPTENNAQLDVFGQNPTKSNAELVGFGINSTKSNACEAEACEENSTKNNALPQKPVKKSAFSAATEPIRAQAELDREDFEQGRGKSPLLGRKSYAIYLGIGLFACLITWIMVFAVNISGLM